MRPSALAVAARLFELEDPETMSFDLERRIQAYLYFVQGWSLAMRGQPMFDDPIMAGPDGPYVPAVREALTKIMSKPERLSVEWHADRAAEMSGHYSDMYEGQTDKMHADEDPDSTLPEALDWLILKSQECEDREQKLRSILVKDNQIKELKERLLGLDMQVDDLEQQP